MNPSVQFLSIDQILSIHRRVVAEFGGTYELRDRGLLESAAAMPPSQFSGEYLHRGLASMAAAYLFHICKNHPFVDGNKRTAVVAAEVFVLLNEASLRATNDELEWLTLGVADGRIAKEEVTSFFEDHVEP